MSSASMAATSTSSSSFLSLLPLPNAPFRHKTSLFLSPISRNRQGNHFLLKHNGYLTVTTRQYSVNLRFNRNPAWVRAEGFVNGVREAMVSPFNVLITGSTKGIGYALAKEFLKAGDNVIICSRSAERVDSAVESLRAEFGDQRVVPNVM